MQNINSSKKLLQDLDINLVTQSRNLSKPKDFFWRVSNKSFYEPHS